MPFRSWPRPAPVLAGVLAAGLMLTAACSHMTPLGPAGEVPQPSQLKSPFVLEAMGIQAPTAAGGCPAGSVALSGGPGQCYRELGTPATFSSAAISPVSAISPPGTAAGPPTYGFTITLPAADVPALTEVTTTAADANGYLGIAVAGRTWLLPQVTQPLPGPRFHVFMPGKDQVLQLQRLLAPPGRQ
ncbi:MAG: hypothetical protein JO345_08410 [Streptosporangiaceae bacterium]|nr:hypothetical protein [Streptosporangiaceae bacterium]